MAALSLLTIGIPQEAACGHLFSVPGVMNISPLFTSLPHSSTAFCLTALTSFMKPVSTLGWVLTFLSWNALQTLLQPTDFFARLYGCGHETHCWRDPFNTLKTELTFPFPAGSGAM